LLHAPSRIVQEEIDPPLLPNAMGCSPAVNFTNILLAAFAKTSYCQKITDPNSKHLKAAYNTFSQKAAHEMFVKLTPGHRLLRCWHLLK